MPPMATSAAIDLRAPFGEPRQTLRRPGHRLERRRVDRTERDIVGIGGKRRVQLVSLWVLTPSLIPADLMADRSARAKILLAEMHETRALLDGLRQ